MEEYDPRRYAADPAISPGGGFFDLSGPVGPDGLNTRQDVSQIETLLGNSGSFDLGRTDGPTGWYGSRLDEGIRAYQGRRGLAVDGLILPDGETLASLKTDLGQTFAPFSPPSGANLTFESPWRRVRSRMSNSKAPLETFGCSWSC